MPKYDFRCEACGSEFSESLPMGTVTLPECLTCKSAKAVRKLIRAPMVHFKGSGFYKNDSTQNSVKRDNPKPIEAPKKIDPPKAP